MRTFFFAVLCFLIAGLSFVHSQEPSPSDGVKSQPVQHKSTASKKPTAEDQRGTEKMPLVIKGIPAEKTPEQTQEDRNERQDKAANERGLTIYTGLLALVTSLMVVVGGAQVGLFVWQLRLIRESLSDAKVAADAAKISADAANKMAFTMKDTAERQLRAYVAATPTTLNGPPNVSQYFSMVNHGQTPAYDVMETGLMDIFPYPLPPNFNFPVLPNPRHGRIVLHPQATHQSGLAGAARIFTNQEISSIGTGQYRLYVYGLITYSDVFKKPHTTKFCHSIPRTLELIEFFKGTLAPGTPLMYESADQHSEAD